MEKWIYITIITIVITMFTFFTIDNYTQEKFKDGKTECVQSCKELSPFSTVKWNDKCLDTCVKIYGEKK